MIHVDGRGRLAKFQVGHLSGPYFTRRSVNYLILLYFRICMCYLLQIWTKVLLLGKKTIYTTLGLIHSVT